MFMFEPRKWDSSATLKVQISSGSGAQVQMTKNASEPQCEQVNIEETPFTPVR